MLGLQVGIHDKPLSKYSIIKQIDWINSLDTASALEYTCCILLQFELQLVFLKLSCVQASVL